MLSRVGVKWPFNYRQIRIKSYYKRDRTIHRRPMPTDRLRNNREPTMPDIFFAQLLEL